MRGHGKIELIDRFGMVVREVENGNVILDQGLRGLINDADSTAANWIEYTQWRIGIGTGYNNPAEAYWLSGLDNLIWTSSSSNTTASRTDNSFTVIAEAPIDQANGLLTEAGLISNNGKAFNRLMFKSDPQLQAADYAYYVQARVGSKYSQLSETEVLTTAATGSITLSWDPNYTGSISDYLVYRRSSLEDNTFRLLTITKNTFLVDAGPGFYNIPQHQTFNPDPAIPGVNLSLAFNPQTKKQPKAVEKTNEYAARITITITF